MNHRKSLLNDSQKSIYETIKNQLIQNEGGIFFIDAPGGTGKTFLINLILADIRKDDEIAIAVASSGIAATLLEGGRTAHSMFKLPLNIHQIEKPHCNIEKGSDLAKILQNSKIIIWDECTMSHKKSIEALDSTQQDLNNNKKIMGGKLIILAGDFRQTLPIIPRSTPADGINACLKSSVLWKKIKQLIKIINILIILHNNC